MKKEIKDFKKDNAGRSMTEMLGVLAIIGVLSLGGIIGYKLAMNRYAANQIAYEINMMKTDAKVKIMQGNDILTLGQPYDGDSDYLGYLNYNEAYTIDFDCVWAGDKFIDEAATCQVANAYYIELQNIPEGICKPLANLINNMNDLIAFDINPKENGEVGEGGECEEGDNVLNAVFSAEPGDLEVLKCEKKEDCPDGLKCHNHLCVECSDDTHCKDGDGGICTENNTCDYCNEGEVRDENNNCVECTTNEHCIGNSKGKICDTTEKKCVECTENSHCNDNTKPYCDINNDNICKSCYEVFGEEKPKWNGSACEECPENEPWNGESCGCLTNDDCESGEYCFIVWKILDDEGNRTYLESKDVCRKGETGECRSLGNYQIKKLNGDNTTYYLSPLGMVWWSAENYCQALGDTGKGSGKMVSWNKLNLNCDNDIVLQDGCKCGENGCSGGDCNGKMVYKTGELVACKKKDSLAPNSKTNVPDKVIEIRELFGETTHIWLEDSGNNACFARVFRTDGYNFMRPRYFGYKSVQADAHAFCY